MRNHASDQLEDDSGVLDPGSYSTGTLRDEDLVDMFDTIGSIVECSDCRAQAKGIREELEDIEESEKCSCSSCGSFREGWQEGIGEALAWLFDHVGEIHVPEGFYFGNIEGDGADIGVFEEEEYWTS